MQIILHKNKTPDFLNLVGTAVSTCINVIISGILTEKLVLFLLCLSQLPDQEIERRALKTFN